MAANIKIQLNTQPKLCKRNPTEANLKRMAPVSSLSSSQSLKPQLWESTSPLQFKGLTKCRNSALYFNRNTVYTICCQVHKEDNDDIKEMKMNGRREALLGIVISAFSFPSLVSTAMAENTVVEDPYLIYTDEAKKFKILIPKGWLVGEGQSDGVRSLTAFYPKETTNSNVSVLISGLGADYTKLESFGKVDEFAETLVSGLDRSWQNPPGVAAKLIDSKSKNGMYYIEYSLQSPGESVRHIYSVLGMQSSGYYNKLYTVTGQFMEGESEKFGSQIQKAVTSFRTIGDR